MVDDLSRPMRLAGAELNGEAHAPDEAEKLILSAWDLELEVVTDEFNDVADGSALPKARRDVLQDAVSDEGELLVSVLDHFDSPRLVEMIREGLTYY